MTTTAEILDFDPKVPHGLCGKRHSNHELVVRCEKRVEARAEEARRRELNAEEVPVEEYIRQRRVEAMPYDKIAAALKRDYPPPPEDLVRPWRTVVLTDSFRFERDEGWSVGNVIELDSRHPRFANWGIE
jgi:hypothetical protein